MFRYRGVEIVMACGSDIRPGLYYLIRYCDCRSGEREWYSLSTEPGRTNMSHEARITGWLGTTNDLSRHAEGCVRVRLDNGRIRIGPVEPSVLAEQEETADEMSG